MTSSLVLFVIALQNYFFFFYNLQIDIFYVKCKRNLQMKQVYTVFPDLFAEQMVTNENYSEKCI